ncbi:uncharacterized protein LOC125618105 [Marmota marmota marmota]|uniref:uncharacterized protein LOC125618105 n=1 Tax=Marmota marmota marmota TaxID=9994 RepID=UPI002091F4EA|nr:uncharacterized protein LOC125618105 [Marmota marmota marmota]
MNYLSKSEKGISSERRAGLGALGLASGSLPHLTSMVWGPHTGHTLPLQGGPSPPTQRFQTMKLWASGSNAPLCTRSLYQTWSPGGRRPPARSPPLPWPQCWDGKGCCPATQGVKANYQLTMDQPLGPGPLPQGCPQPQRPPRGPSHLKNFGTCFAARQGPQLQPGLKTSKPTPWHRPASNLSGPEQKNTDQHYHSAAAPRAMPGRASPSHMALLLPVAALAPRWCAAAGHAALPGLARHAVPPKPTPAGSRPVCLPHKHPTDPRSTLGSLAVQMENRCPQSHTLTPGAALKWKQKARATEEKVLLARLETRGDCTPKSGQPSPDHQQEPKARAHRDSDL